MYAQAATEQNALPRNGAYGIVMRGVQKCTCAGASLWGKNSAPLCCIKLDTATDPACGSGNFLTETYLSIRRIENEIIKNIIELDKTVQNNQIALGDFGSDNSIIKVNLSQFYGIEINDFAVAVLV